MQRKFHIVSVALCVCEQEWISQHVEKEGKSVDTVMEQCEWVTSDHFLGVNVRHVT